MSSKQSRGQHDKYFDIGYDYRKFAAVLSSFNSMRKCINRQKSYASANSVASFLPAALPTFTGTTKPSESLVIFAVLPLKLLGILLK